MAAGLRWLSLAGTASRREAGAWVLIAAAVGLVTAWQGRTGAILAGLPRLGLFLALAAGVAGLLAAMVRRLHEAGRSGWWAMLLAVPGAGLLAVPAILVLPPAPRPGSRFAPSLRYRAGTALVLAVAAAVLSRAFWTPYWIPAASMKPTLLVGDYMIVVRPLWLVPHRGEVIVFRHPARDEDFVKRLIGLPGDRVQVRDGVLWLNGAAVPRQPLSRFAEPYAPQGPDASQPRCIGGVPAPGEPCEKARFAETLPGGPSYEVLDIGPGPLDNTPVFTVPEGSYFFMGDNRDNSTDSRVPVSAGGVGFVPGANLIGRAALVVFSSAGRQLLDPPAWRAGRYWTAIR